MRAGWKVGGGAVELALQLSRTVRPATYSLTKRKWQEKSKGKPRQLTKDEQGSRRTKQEQEHTKANTNDCITAFPAAPQALRIITHVPDEHSGTTLYIRNSDQQFRSAL